MSMINAAPQYRRDEHAALRVPVVMPVVQVTIDKDGFLTILLDREPYSADGALVRDELKRVLNDIATDLETPIRVEVHEADDSTFTDIMTPEAPKLSVVQPIRQPGTPQAPPSIGEVTGTGFLPNEEVAVAVVVAHQVADTDGTARLRLPHALLEAHPGLVVLMGQQSGSVVVSGEIA